MMYCVDVALLWCGVVGLSFFVACLIARFCVWLVGCLLACVLVVPFCYVDVLW